mgnify:CR=1 FL=1
MDKSYESPVIEMMAMEAEGVLAASVTNEDLEWESDVFEF